jgi:hypothetical protein
VALSGASRLASLSRSSCAPGAAREPQLRPVVELVGVQEGVVVEVHAQSSGVSDLSTANNPDGDAFSGMKGVLSVT